MVRKLAEIGALVVLLSPAPSAAQVTTRIISESGAPVLLVGNACGPAEERVFARKTFDAPGHEAHGSGRLQSPEFVCVGGCDVAFVPVDRATAVQDVTMGVILLKERGQYAQLTMPAVYVEKARKCDSNAVTRASPTRRFAPSGMLLYVAKVKFKDGSVWAVNNDEFTLSVVREWQRRTAQVP
jgi:hypothetical protein